MPERLDEIREIFRDHPVVEVSDEQLEQGQVDVEGLKKFLVEDRQFSQKRFDNAMDLLEDAGLVRTGGRPHSSLSEIKRNGLASTDSPFHSVTTPLAML